MSVGKKTVKLGADYEIDDCPVVRRPRSRTAPLLELFKRWRRSNDAANLIDVGVTESYWNIGTESVFEDYNVRIVLFNLPGTPSQGPPSDRFEHLSGDACDCSQFEDASKITRSSSVVYHVGDWRRMMAFTFELKPVGHTYNAQTPDCCFPVKPHATARFIHWLPKLTRIWLFMHLQIGDGRTFANTAKVLEAQRGCFGQYDEARLAVFDRLTPSNYCRRGVA